MTTSTWKDGLSRAGLYYDGIIEESKLQDILELHKRDTVSTFGTRTSRRVNNINNSTLKELDPKSNTTIKESTKGKGCFSSHKSTQPTAVDKENVCLETDLEKAVESKVVGI